MFMFIIVTLVRYILHYVLYETFKTNKREKRNNLVLNLTSMYKK